MSLVIGSIDSRITRRTVTWGLIIALALSSLSMVTQIFTPATGAWYFDAAQGSVTTTTAGLGLVISNTDANGADTAALDFSFVGLKPGDTQTKSFTVKNTGTVSGALSVYADNLQADKLGANSLASLSYGIDGYGTLSPVTATRLVLGSLQPGKTKTFSLTNRLGNEVGNEWQGKTVTSTLHMILEQEH